MTICWCTASWIIKATHTHTHTHTQRGGEGGREGGQSWEGCSLQAGLGRTRHACEASRQSKGGRVEKGREAEQETKGKGEQWR
jgi:hypothetical protein